MTASPRHSILGIPAELLLSTLLAGAAPLGYPPGQQTVGRMRTVGPFVSANGAPAWDGQLLNAKDRLGTGAGVRSMRKLSGRELREVTRRRDRSPTPGPVVRPQRAGEAGT